MFLRKSIFKNYNCLLVPEDAGLPIVMLTPYQVMKVQYENAIHFQITRVH